VAGAASNSSKLISYLGAYFSVAFDCFFFLPSSEPESPESSSSSSESDESRLLFFFLLWDDLFFFFFSEVSFLASLIAVLVLTVVVAPVDGLSWILPPYFEKSNSLVWGVDEEAV
jgi:hypothetical protein